MHSWAWEGQVGARRQNSHSGRAVSVTTAERAEIVHRILATRFNFASCARRRQKWVPIQDGRITRVSRSTLACGNIAEAIVVHPAAKANEVCIVAGISGGAHNVRILLLFPYLRAHAGGRGAL